MFSPEEIQRLARVKIFFGHKSVGDNILEGVRDLEAVNANLSLKMVSSSDPASVKGPALVETSLGENRNPESKNKAFAAALDKGLGAEGGIVLYKYCFVDVDAATDITQLFENYRKGIDDLKRKRPELKIVHVTVPLTTVEPAAKAWIKSMLGRVTERDGEVKRNQFNQRLRQTFASVDPIFDLAEVESTRPDGSRTYFYHGNERVYTLVPEYTTDGGHLNELGRRAAAERLLHVLSQVH
jgi:hypothetical protein